MLDSDGWKQLDNIIDVNLDRTEKIHFQVQVSFN
jgi:hypothetical protein